ncbi:agmatine deiminase family protein [Altericista sp. CCNU0014]|uniref:agmatine deiminase family protein n=1 Tax=Altericista sp. CCNU0014 TaxID=3082949 RepID=UPI00384DC352
MNQTPTARGFRQPAEWESHRACWLAFPHNAYEWGEPLAAAQAEFVAFCEAIADVDPRTGKAQGEQIELLVANIEVLEQARRALARIPVNFHLIPYDDIWLRDCAPIFIKDVEGAVAAATFQFNVWGRKFDLPLDERVATQIAKGTGLPVFEHSFVLEGGSVETDGEGTCLTTRQCLLNPNRNPGRDPATLERDLKSALGYQKILWLEDGLANDHTDGHIDTIARFVAPGAVMCMVPQTADDPNAAVLERIARTLATFSDAQGRPLRVVTVPSPGRVLDDAGQVMPASYVNFYIGNSTVVVPTYGSEFDRAAVAAIAAHFPNHRTVGRSAKAILTAGGAFHCITQQEPQSV